MVEKVKIEKREDIVKVFEKHLRAAREELDLYNVLHNIYEDENWAKREEQSQSKEAIEDAIYRIWR